MAASDKIAGPAATRKHADGRRPRAHTGSGMPADAARAARPDDLLISLGPGAQTQPFAVPGNSSTASTPTMAANRIDAIHPCFL